MTEEIQKELTVRELTTRELTVQELAELVRLQEAAGGSFIIHIRAGGEEPDGDAGTGAV